MYGRPLLQRDFEAVLVLLVAALLLRWAVTVILSIAWPLITIVGAVALLVVGWRVFQARRSGW